jgi:hypothetical protein
LQRREGVRVPVRQGLTELLKRRKVPIPTKQKFFSRKRDNQSRNRKPGCMKETEGVQYPVQNDRKEMKRRFAAR